MKKNIELKKLHSLLQLHVQSNSHTLSLMIKIVITKSRPLDYSIIIFLKHGFEFVSIQWVTSWCRSWWSFLKFYATSFVNHSYWKWIKIIECWHILIIMIMLSLVIQWQVVHECSLFQDFVHELLDIQNYFVVMFASHAWHLDSLMIKGSL